MRLRPLRTLLIDYLDVSRFQKVPRADAVTSLELDRLAAAAPAQAKGLLETEGYFDAEVTIARSDPPNGIPRLTLKVVPGPQVRVANVAIDATEPLAPRTATREEPWSDRLDHLRKTWLLRPGQPFRQPAWTSAKTVALAALRADGYPTASWRSTHARVDATANTAALDLELDGGPLYRLGAIRVEGVSRFDEVAVRHLATFFPGTVYDEKLLLDYQDRLLKVGLYEGASVELDASGPPEAAPVIVRVKELTQYQATFGVGYSANTGPRVSVEHWDRKSSVCRGSRTRR
jgi:Outer membrane protein